MGLSNVLRGWLSDGESIDETGPRGSDDAGSQARSGSDADSRAAPDDGSDASVDAVIYECRNCGTTVSSETAVCPTCESSAIAEYVIE